MDQNVVDAQIRWPNVPAAFGWLSLDPRGQWRLHQGGASDKGGPGDPIANQQIVGFMNRNYTHDDQGRWFFQNGPQRVYVRLDAAPLILHYDAHHAAFVAHTGEQAGGSLAWALDDSGRLFAKTELGPGLVIDRDLIAVLDAMSIAPAATESRTSANLLLTLEKLVPGEQVAVEHPCSAGRLQGRLQGPIMLTAMLRGDLAHAWSFVASPKDTGA